MSIRQLLSEIVCDAFNKLGYDSKFGNVSLSNRPDLCQFQCNGAMAVAKKNSIPPMTVASEIVQVLQDNENISSVEAVHPGFININIPDSLLSKTMNDMLTDERLLLPTMESQVIVVDFGGPNIAKPLHVGHLRSAIIGDSLCRLARFLGHKVIGDVHLGD